MGSLDKRILKLESRHTKRTLRIFMREQDESDAVVAVRYGVSLDTVRNAYRFTLTLRAGEEELV